MKLFSINQILSGIIITILAFGCGGTNNDQNQDNTEMMEGDHDNMMEKGSPSDTTQHEMMGGNGMMSGQMQEAMMSGKMDESMMDNMRNIHQLLTNHEKIQRRVENLENGVKTWTESTDPAIVPAIQTHVRQMKARVENNRPIRQMDPLFREIFEHANEIEMQIENTEKGVYVLETSDNPQVVKLIQQHANRAVSEFVEQGMSRAMEPTPLPEGYRE